MRCRISIRGRVRPSVRWSRVIFERRKTPLPMLWWRRNLTWTKRQSRTIHKWHQNVRPLVSPSIQRKKMIEKRRRGSRILSTLAVLVFIEKQIISIFVNATILLSAWHEFSKLIYIVDSLYIKYLFCKKFSFFFEKSWPGDTLCVCWCHF